MFHASPNFPNAGTERTIAAENLSQFAAIAISAIKTSPKPVAANANLKTFIAPVDVPTANA